MVFVQTNQISTCIFSIGRRFYYNRFLKAVTQNTNIILLPAINIITSRNCVLLTCLSTTVIDQYYILSLSSLFLLTNL